MKTCQFPTGVRRNAYVGLLLISVLVLGASTAAAAEGDAAENLALGKRYVLFPRPTYAHCTDAGDLEQLTDGNTTTAYFWTQQGTVGWQSVRYATITIDLGEIQAIAGASLTTAAGVAGVTWPQAVYVLVSDDGREFYSAGELVSLDRKQHGSWPEGYAIRRLVTRELRTWGRYVQLVIVPLPGGPYLFTDEVEVFRGPPSLVDAARGRGEPTNAQTLYEQGRLQRAVAQRRDLDAAALKKQITAADLEASVQACLAAQTDAALAAGETIVADASFRAVLPLDAQHAALFAVQAELWNRLGHAPLSAWAGVLWDPLTPMMLPQRESSRPIEVHTMQGEYRAAALNLANSTDQPQVVRLRFRNLPQSPLPEYVTLHEVEWTDTSQGVPVAAALPAAARTSDGWTVTVLPGLVRQVWMTWHVTDVPAGDYAGSILAETPNQPPLEIPVRLKVWPFQFPSQPSLWLGGWCYTNSGGSRGVTAQNRAAFVEHLQQRFVNAPWATGSVLRSFEFDRADPQQIRLDTKPLDDWLALWPNAKRYMVFLAVADYGGAIQSSLGGATLGSPDFDQRVGTWIKAWVAHLRSRGITPDQLALLIHDEPHEGSDIGPLLAWARAIRAAEPDVLIWEDPTYRNPAAAPAELFEACSILCPNRPMWLEGGEPFARFYRRQQAAGRMLQFYSCSGPARLLDPYAYYRLQAWQCWQEGATGSFFWAFGDNSGASSWNEYFATSGPYAPLFLDDATVTAGKQMEAIRESVEDYEYFVMLRAAVARAKSAGRTDAAVTEAETLLTDGARSVLAAEGVNKLRWDDPKDRTLADAVRVQILEAMTALQ
jgi:hypothetical protein